MVGGMEMVGAKKRIAVSALSTFNVFLLSRTVNIGHWLITSLTTNWQRTISVSLCFLRVRPTPRPMGSMRKPLCAFELVKMLHSSPIPAVICTILIVAVAVLFKRYATGFVVRNARVAW